MKRLSLLLLLATGAAWIVDAKNTDALAYGAKGVTPLMAAAAHGDLKAIERQLRAGEDVNARTAARGPTGAYVGGWTPLLLATLEGQVQAAELLVANGAKLNARTANGQTCLSLALFDEEAAKRQALVKLFLVRKADPNEVTGKGQRPLHIAAIQGDTESARMLIAAGAKVDGLDRADHATPLMLAAAGGRADLVRLLLEHGANPLARNDAGLTPADFARRGNHPDLVPLLEQSGSPTAGAQSSAVLDPEMGFQGIRLGTDLRLLNNLQVTDDQTPTGIPCKTAIGSVNQFLDLAVPLDGLEYLFFRRQASANQIGLE